MINNHNFNFVNTRKRAKWPIWLLSIVVFSLLCWGLLYLNKRLEARRERLQYWQEREAEQADKIVTIIEGWNNEQIAAKLAENNLGFTAKQFLQVAGEPRQDYRLWPTSKWPQDFSDRYDFLKDKPKYFGLEGYLFPDTYRFSPSSTPEEVIIRFLDNFNRQLTPAMRQDIENQGKSIYEIITMASILEKEVRNETDMKLVADIFWRRLKNGQRLESCATLAYALGENKPQYSYEETRLASPYNTYINDGLPPGPICNPGLKAIRAAIYPTPNDYNFFLSRPDNGQTIFSRTFEEHSLNKNKYLQ